MRHKLLALLLFMAAPAWAQDKVIHIFGEIRPGMEYTILDQVAKQQNLPGDEVFIINSPGGDCRTGDRIIEILERMKVRGLKSVCIVDGQAASMAFNIFTHCDVRLATEKSRFLVHPLYWANWPANQLVNRQNLLKAIKSMEFDDLKYANANAKAMGLSYKDYERFALREITWSANRLLELGYLNDLVEKSDSK